MDTLSKDVLYQIWQYAAQQQSRAFRLWTGLPNRTPENQREEARLYTADWARASQQLFELYEKAQ